MKIVVCVKTEPGAAITSEDAFQRGGRVAPSVPRPFDGHAVEEALKVIEHIGRGEVVVVAVTTAEALGAVRAMLALGAQRAVMLCDPALDGGDILAVSRALAALLAREPADLYLTCSWSGDVDGTMLWVATAERLGLPVLTQARSLRVADDGAITQRQTESGDLVMTAWLPCMIEVTDTINKSRYPTIKGSQAARRKPIEMLRLADLGLAPDRVGSAGAGTRIVELAAPPARRPPLVIHEAENAAEMIVAFLDDRKLIG